MTDFGPPRFLYIWFLTEIYSDLLEKVTIHFVSGLGTRRHDLECLLSSHQAWLRSYSFKRDVINFQGEQERILQDNIQTVSFNDL